jgi:hypothetical protein
LTEKGKRALFPPEPVEKNMLARRDNGHNGLSKHRVIEKGSRFSVGTNA